MSDVEMMNIIHSIEILSNKRKALAENLFAHPDALRVWLRSLWAPLFVCEIKISFAHEREPDEENNFGSSVGEAGEIIYSIEVGEDSCAERFMHKMSDLLLDSIPAALEIRDSFDYVPELLS